MSTHEWERTGTSMDSLPPIVGVICRRCGLEASATWDSYEEWRSGVEPTPISKWADGECQPIWAPVEEQP